MSNAQSDEDLAREILTSVTASGTKRLIVVLSPGNDLRLGGILSIGKIYQATAAMQDVHDATVVMCTVPGEPSLFKYTWFDNENYMLDLESVLTRCDRLDQLLLHIPEYAVNTMLDWLAAHPSLLRDVPDVHLNVMLQNIDIAAGQDIAGLVRFGRVTCTTAHEAYTTAAVREAIGVTLHRLSVCAGPEHYARSGYEAKEPTLVVSHDEHPLKDQVLQLVAQSVPELRIQVVRDLHYDDYKALIGRAKWSLTFGEGLDGYFVEPIFSGSVAFAVFNDRFFTPAFAQLENVYGSWEMLMESISADLQRLDEPVAYTECWRRAYDLLSDIYSTDRFRDNLAKFYRGDYTFP